MPFEEKEYNHFGLLLRERRMCRLLTMDKIAKETKISVRRLRKIEETGEVTDEERNTINRMFHRSSYGAFVTFSRESVNEQIEIVEGIKEGILLKLKNKIDVELLTLIEENLVDFTIETTYYGVVLSRLGIEDKVVSVVRKKRGM